MIVDIGNQRIEAGVGANWLMAPFIHVSRDRPGRFTDGSHAVYSAGDREEVAIREVAYHHARFMAKSREEPGWTLQFRVLINALDLDLHDARADPAMHDPYAFASPRERYVQRPVERDSSSQRSLPGRRMCRDLPALI